MTIGVGERFPVVNVLSVEGPVDLACLWLQERLIIAFPRMWCPFCQQAAIQLTDAASELERLGVVTVIVYREEVATVASTCGDRGTYVVDRTGTVVYAHQARTAVDIAPIDNVVAAVRFAA